MPKRFRDLQCEPEQCRDDDHDGQYHHHPGDEPVLLLVVHLRPFPMTAIRCRVVNRTTRRAMLMRAPGEVRLAIKVCSARPAGRARWGQRALAPGLGTEPLPAPVLDVPSASDYVANAARRDAIRCKIRELERPPWNCRVAAVLQSQFLVFSGDPLDMDDIRDHLKTAVNGVQDSLLACSLARDWRNARPLERLSGTNFGPFLKAFSSPSSTRTHPASPS